MSSRERVTIRKLPTGVPGLDEIMGGGLPEFSFNVIAGDQGAGKTTLANQILFANASAERPGLYFTLLGEPAIKLLRYQQQMRFFDLEKVGSAVHFVNLSHEMMTRDLSRVLAAIVGEVERRRPAIVVVDSFRTNTRGPSAIGTADQLDFAAFVQQLGLHLAGWQATTFLVGEYREVDMQDDPVFSVADNILWLSQPVERNSSVRKIRATKVRGQARVPGLHPYRISEAGVEVFPRQAGHRPAATPRALPLPRASTGVPGLDAMLAGGVPAGDTMLLAGPAGSGKSTLALQFLLEGVRRGERVVAAILEEQRQSYVERARELGADLPRLERDGRLSVVHLHTLDVSTAETVVEIRAALVRLEARRLVLDSLSALEQSLAPSFRDDFHESPFRMVRGLRMDGVTVLVTVGANEFFTDVSFRPHAFSFLMDHVVLQSYVRVGSERRRVIEVLKSRGTAHSRKLCEYEVRADGVQVIGELSADQPRGALPPAGRPD
jgi:circadian clock protein KaiC